VSEHTIRRLEAWSQIGILVVTVILHAVAVEARLAKVEQKVDDLKELILDTHGGALRR